MALVRAVVTRAFWLDGESRPVGAELMLAEHLFVELQTMGKAAHAPRVADPAPVTPEKPVTRPRARKEPKE